MNSIDQMLEAFYSGSIGQPELESLFDAFLGSREVRERWATDAAVIIPLAVARRDRRMRTRAAHRGWRVAAAILVLVVSVGSAVAYAKEQQPRVYSTDAACDVVCAVQWLDNAVETAL
ncbi:MAG: hypothetical protein J6I49_05275 [Bacteroidales bacterium]|nr:hypothetical protein [Bacteroidales bacterium]